MILKNKDIELAPFQHDFVNSTARYPHMIGGIGTGKTMCAIQKGMILSEAYPSNLGLIVRKSFSDLQDSTMKDFKEYTGLRVNSKQDAVLSNGSEVMFRHGQQVGSTLAEMKNGALKNINLGWFYIEQAEEFLTNDIFTYLRDRLRRANVGFRQGFMISNANGHNWCWRDWVNNPPSADYFVVEANSFMNEKNLPADFVKDLRAMELEAPSHYRRYVMNSYEDEDLGDKIYRMDSVSKCERLNLDPYGFKILSCDVARFGEDRTVFGVYQQTRCHRWRQLYLQSYKGLDLMQTTGHLMDLRHKYSPHESIVDDRGLGGGVVDRCNEQRANVISYGQLLAKSTPYKNPNYKTKDDENHFKLAKLINDGDLQLIPNEDQSRDFNVVSYTFKSTGQRSITPKDILKKLGIRSPDYVDMNVMFSAVIDHFPKFHNKRPNFPDRYKADYNESTLGAEPEYAKSNQGEHYDVFGREMRS